MKQVLEHMIRAFLKDILHIRINEEKLANVMQFVKFGFVGISNTMLHYCIYLACTLMGFQYMLANFIAFTISVINSFYWNNRYVFKDSGEVKRFWLFTFIKTYISYSLTGILLNSILLHIEIDILKINKWIAPMANLLITIPLNFIINKLWAYKIKKSNS